MAKPIRLWLDPFIRETLTNMVVWPNRIVVPMLPEEATGSLDHLYLRSVAHISSNLHKRSCFMSNPFVSECLFVMPLSFCLD